eukprot:Hpha_TRINITY_DN34489_c0_g1::TRINITY_DN34489_c0_g1_i1::g.96046::m.96046
MMSGGLPPGAIAVAAAGTGGIFLAIRCLLPPRLSPPPLVRVGGRKADDPGITTQARAEIVRETQQGISTLLEFVHDEVRRIDHEQGFDTFAAGLVPLSVPPLVLILGNHNSGKSTFVNSLCKKNVQETGAAPHYLFSMVTRGVNEDMKGPALVAKRQDIGELDDLARFGDGFVSHLELKRRELPREAALPEGVVLVDTPGMIDTPGKSPQRPYDFPGVVRWFARRAALTLLFFDGSNPGTTRETLSIWRGALNDYADRHKLMLVLGKSDRFSNVEDFARTYGALCWNLAKVSEEKDAPPVETLFNDVSGSSQLADAEAANLPVGEFLESRDKVMKAVSSVVRTHVDNALTAADTSIQRLTVAAQVSDRAAKRIWLLRAGAAGVSLLAAVMPLGFALFRSRMRAEMAEPPFIYEPEGWGEWVLRWTCATGMSIGGGLGSWWLAVRLQGYQVTAAGLDGSYAAEYGRGATHVSTHQRWSYVRRQLVSLFASPEVSEDGEAEREAKAVPLQLPRASSARLKQLTQEVMPRLRSLADFLKAHQRAQRAKGDAR